MAGLRYLFMATQVGGRISAASPLIAFDLQALAPRVHFTRKLPVNQKSQTWKHQSINTIYSRSNCTLTMDSTEKVRRGAKPAKRSPTYHQNRRPESKKTGGTHQRMPGLTVT